MIFSHLDILGFGAFRAGIIIIFITSYSAFNISAYNYALQKKMECCIYMYTDVASGAFRPAHQKGGSEPNPHNLIPARAAPLSFYLPEEGNFATSAVAYAFTVS